jgi:type IV pilus assembly protein PilO
MPLTMPKIALPTRPTKTVARSQTERLWLIGGGLVALLVALIAYFLFISPQRSQTADVNSQAAQARQDNASLQARLDALREQSKRLDVFERQLTSAQLALPSTAGMSDFLRSLQQLGNTTLTDITQLTVGQPVNVTTVVAGTPTVAPSATANATTAPAAVGVPAATAVGPQLYALPINAEIAGAPTALNRFLEQLQAVQPRAVLITQITELTGTTTGGAAIQGKGVTSLQLTMDAFVAPTNPTEKASLSAASH